MNNGEITGFGQLMRNDLATARALAPHVTPYMQGELVAYEARLRANSK